MDGNRTHPGRLSSAPQTVLKTAFLASAGARRRARTIEIGGNESADIRPRPPLSTGLAVILAVRRMASSDHATTQQTGMSLVVS